MITQRWMLFVLLLGGLTAHSPAAAASEQSSPTVAVVPIQVQLRALGYDPGPIAGRGGRHTIGALTSYARDREIVLNEATASTVVARLRVEVYVMLLNGEAIEDSLTATPQGEPRGLDRSVVSPLAERDDTAAETLTLSTYRDRNDPAAR